MVSFWSVIGEILLQAGRPCGAVDDTALFLSLQTSPWVWRLKAWVWFLALNNYIQGWNLRSRMLTCFSLIPLPKDTRQSISDNFLLTGCSATQTSFKTWHSDDILQIHQVRKLESNVFTDGLGPYVFKFTLKGQCLGKSIEFTFPVNSVLRPYTMDQGPVCPKSL